MIAEHLEAVTSGQIKRLLRRTLDHLADQGVGARARRQIRYNAVTRPHGHFLRTFVVIRATAPCTAVSARPRVPSARITIVSVQHSLLMF
jgi:hypothetical protein